MQQLQNMKRRLERRFTPEKLQKMESGQAIVLIALVMVSLIAFTGLAIDGGGLFLLYRDVQNASDAAAVAAAYALCTDADFASVQNAALEAAEDNGFDNDGVDNWVTVNNPPLSGERAGDVRYVQVTIRSLKPSHFIHIVYKGTLEVTVTAVSYCSAPFNPYTWGALTALASDAVCGDNFAEIQWSGSEGYVDGGITSNGDIDVSGSDNTFNDVISAVDNVQEPESGNNIYEAGTGSPITNGQPVNDPGIYQMSDYVPGGAVATAVEFYWSPETDTAGVYFNSDTWDGSRWRPQRDPGIPPLKGLFYIPGEVDIGLGGPGDVVFDTDVGVSIAATGTVNISYPDTYTYYVGGMMIFSTYANNYSDCSTNGVQLNGGSDVIWQGVIYAPNANVQISADDILANPGAIIGKTVKVNGSNFTLIYDPEIFDPVPPTVQIAE